MAQLSSVLCENPNVEVGYQRGKLASGLDPLGRAGPGRMGVAGRWGWGEGEVGIRSPPDQGQE